MGFDRVQYKFIANSKIRKKLLKSSKVSLCFTRKIVLYSFTKFGILKHWTNIQSLRRFCWGFWQTSKQIYRRLQYKQKVFEEFQGMSHFSRKIVMYSSTKFGILKSWTNIQLLRTFDLVFWETWKQIYRKLQYRVKDFEEFQGLSDFPRKMVLYSLTKFGIQKPWTNILWLRRSNLSFWQTSIQIYRNLQYQQRAFQEFEGLSRFPRRNVLYSPTKFGILKPWANIQSLRRFDLGFWQISKQIYRKCQYREKVFTKPQALRCFPTKMILYSPTKFGILKPSTNTW